MHSLSALAWHFGEAYFQLLNMTVDSPNGMYARVCENKVMHG